MMLASELSQGAVIAGWIGIGILWALFLLGILYLVLGGILAHILLHPKKRTDEYLIEYESTEKGLDKSRLDIPYENIVLTSTNPEGYDIRARYYAHPSGSKKTVISVHGYNSSSVSQLKYLHIWQELGYNVLMPDNTTSGESGGSMISLGYLEKNDILSWIELLKTRDPDVELAMYGESMGGTTVIGAAALCPYKLKWTVIYCTYANVKILAKTWLKAHNKPAFLASFIAPSVFVMTFMLYGIKLHQISSLRDINLIDNPILLMHSKGDKLINVENGRMLKNERPDADYYEYEESPHCRSWKYYPEIFENNIKTFVKKAEGISANVEAAASVEENK